MYLWSQKAWSAVKELAPLQEGLICVSSHCIPMPFPAAGQAIPARAISKFSTVHISHVLQFYAPLLTPH